MLKKIILIVSLSTVAALNSSAESGRFNADTLALSLDQCVDIALSENPTIKVADMEIKRYDYSKRETLGQLLPSVAFGATYNRTLAKQTMYMNMKGFGSAGGSTDENTDDATEAPARSSNGIKVGLDNSYSLGFTASMPLIAPQLWKALDISESKIIESVEQARKSKLEMVNQVKSAYYTLLLAIDSHKAIQESYDMAEFTANLYAKQFDNGTATRYDVLRTQVALKNVEPELTQAEIAIKQARLQLAILLGLDPESNVVAPVGALADYESTMFERSLRANDDLSGNTSLRLLDIQARQLDQNVAMQKLSFLPTLSLTANYNWTTMSDGSPIGKFNWNPYSMLGLTLNIPIFQGFQRHSKLKQAQIQSREMVFQRQNLERSLKMQVELAVDNINKNLKQISSCGESVGQAVTAHDIMRQSFEIGAATYLDLRDSELALTRSRLAYYQSIYNYLVADSELELLLGNSPKIDQSSGSTRQ